MSSKPIRVFVVEADPAKAPPALAFPAKITEIEIVGVAHNRHTASNQIETVQPDVLLVDLMLPGYRSIEFMRQVSSAHPEMRILALAPADPPHDRIILAVHAGARGYVCRDADRSEFIAAIQRVHAKEVWLPVQTTYEVLQESAAELEVSARERRDRLGNLILGFLPLGGVLAGMTALLWREYWGTIGVRVVDLGIDPATRMINVLASLLLLIGVLGPLLYVGKWSRTFSAWIAGKPGASDAIAKGRALQMRRTNMIQRVAWVVIATLVLAVTALLAIYAPLPIVLFVGPAIAVVLLASVLDLDTSLPAFLKLPRMTAWRMLIVMGIFILVFLIALSAEIVIWGPDLRVDGLHGVLVQDILGFGAQPVTVYDLDGRNEPLGTLYLGGNADLYVLYNPCKGTVEFLPVGSSRVQFIDRVVCPPP